MFKGLAFALYQSSDIEKAKAWYSQVLGVEPYFNSAGYVGFNVGGYELGLQGRIGEGLAGLGGSIPHWRVEDIEATFNRLLELGATAINKPAEVGDGIKVAVVKDPFGNALGIIQHPHFKVG